MNNYAYYLNTVDGIEMNKEEARRLFKMAIKKELYKFNVSLWNDSFQ